MSLHRLQFRGTPWTNTDDQVLLAALSAGNRDWQRVASNLRDKTAQQCRDRWEKYLDPRLNLHEEWSVEEDTLLVELQQRFPFQWKLIAEQLTKMSPQHFIRPSWLCAEHYQKLMAQLEFEGKQQSGQLAAHLSLEQFLQEKQRGWINQRTLEERPARADTVSGDPNRDEVVNITVSRLANQDQKKGLRKERERQLSEASFQAKLQKQREGVESGTLSARERRRMQRAVEEDERRLDGAKRPRDDDDEDDDAESEEDVQEEDQQRFGVMDVARVEREAGVQRRHREIVRHLPGPPLPHDGQGKPAASVPLLEPDENGLLYLKEKAPVASEVAARYVKQEILAIEPKDKKHQTREPLLLEDGQPTPASQKAAFSPPTGHHSPSRPAIGGGIQWKDLVLGTASGTGVPGEQPSAVSSTAVNFDSLFAPLEKRSAGATEDIDASLVEAVLRQSAPAPVSAVQESKAAAPSRRRAPTSMERAEVVERAQSTEEKAEQRHSSNAKAMQVDEEGGMEDTPKGLSVHLLQLFDEEHPNAETRPLPALPPPATWLQAVLSDEVAETFSRLNATPEEVLEAAERRASDMLLWEALHLRDSSSAHPNALSPGAASTPEALEAAAARIEAAVRPASVALSSMETRERDATGAEDTLGGTLGGEHPSLEWYRESARRWEAHCAPQRETLLRQLEVAFVDDGFRRWSAFVFLSVKEWKARHGSPASDHAASSVFLHEFLYYLERYWSRRYEEAAAALEWEIRCGEQERVAMRKSWEACHSALQQVSEEEQKWQERYVAMKLTS